LIKLNRPVTYENNVYPICLDDEDVLFGESSIGLTKIKDDELDLELRPVDSCPTLDKSVSSATMGCVTGGVKNRAIGHES